MYKRHWHGVEPHRVAEFSSLEGDWDHRRTINERTPKSVFNYRGRNSLEDKAFVKARARMTSGGVNISACLVQFTAGFVAIPRWVKHCLHSSRNIDGEVRLRSNRAHKNGKRLGGELTGGVGMG